MINIGIVDDHTLVRTGLRQVLGDEVDFRVTGEAVNGREALDLARSGTVDVLLMDLSMPEHGGVDALLAIKARFPQLPVIILSGFPEQTYAVTLLKQGASAYLGKDCDPSEIATAIRTVVRGRKYVTPAVAELLADQLNGGNDAPHDALSERELQVFLRLAKGETVGGIAESMFLSVKTVSTYRSRVLEKLSLQSNSDLTYYAMKNGLMQ
jgi:DNA-binding NarL/FixJ family response regulator